MTATGVAGTIEGEATLQFSNPTLSFTGTGSPTTGASQIYLNGGTSNRIDFNQTGAGAPAFTTRSAGTKIALYPNVSATSVDIGLGYMAVGGVPSMWYSILQPTANGAFYWYAGTTQIMALVNLAAGTRRLDLTAGTVANPAISAGLNSSDTNTGIYFPAADTIGFVEGGAEAMRIDSNGTVNFLAGTASLPSINAGLSSSDTNTGIYFPAADTIGFVEGGVEAMRINSSGNVGIGLTTQTALLQLNSVGSTTTGAAQLYISGSTLNRIDFATAGVAAPATTTRSAGTKITLYPSVDASNVDYGLGILAGALWYSVPTATSSHWHAFYGGTTERFRVNGSGTVWVSGGTIALPVISAGLNSSDTDTGIYFPAANSLGLVIGAIEIVRLSGNTTSFSGGSVSLPAINAGLNSNDTNTGIYFPSDDTIGFSTSATTRGIINNTGYGIQTTPSDWIHLSSTPASSKYLNIDAAQTSNNPNEYNPSGGNMVGRIWGNIGDNYVLGTPDLWMEIKLNGDIVLIPCYTPSP